LTIVEFAIKIHEQNSVNQTDWQQSTFVPRLTGE